VIFVTMALVTLISVVIGVLALLAAGSKGFDSCQNCGFPLEERGTFCSPRCANAHFADIKAKEARKPR
jgi:hypothetical protein